MTPRSLSNMMLVIAVVQIIQAVATGWLASVVWELRYDLDMQMK